MMLWWLELGILSDLGRLKKIERKKYVIKIVI